MAISAYAAEQAHGSLVPFTFEDKPLAPNHVSVAVEYCGICHSDIHLIDNDWATSEYPLVPGHEIIGKVIALGDDVKHLAVGDRVGIGWQSGSCLHCEWCISGKENFCADNKATAVDQFGGFAERVTAQSRFVFKIPESLDSAKSAPLLCAGITVYTPLRYYNIHPAMHVGIIGIGGLGHLAIQFAHHWGCKVSALSTSKDKADDCLALGADQFIHTKNPDQLSLHENSFDFLIYTAPHEIDGDQYLKLLRPGGKFCILGAGGTVTASCFEMIPTNKSIVASGIGNATMINEMLTFAARHQVQAKIEIVNLGDVNQALEKIRANNMRYRAVVKI